MERLDVQVNSLLQSIPSLVDRFERYHAFLMDEMREERFQGHQKRLASATPSTLQETLLAKMEMQSKEPLTVYLP